MIKAWNDFLGREQNIQASHNMLKTVDATHARVHEGKSYGHAEKHTVASSGTKDFLIVVGGTQMHLHSFDLISDAGPIEIHLYESPVLDVNSMGSEDVWRNRNRASARVTSSQLFTDPVIDVNSLGLHLNYNLIESATGGSIKQAGGVSESLGEWVLPTGGEYLIRVTNNDATNAATIAPIFLMYEE